MAIAEIYVTLKPALLDVQGATVLKSLHQLGHTQAGDVRIGKYIAVSFDDALQPAEMQAHLDAMCRELLANPVIEDYRIEIGGANAPAPTPASAAPVVSSSDEVPSPAPARSVAAPETTAAQFSSARITSPQGVSPTELQTQTVAQVMNASGAAAPVATAPDAVSLAPSAGANPSFADPFAVDFASYSAMSADEQLTLQGRAWQQHGAWIENELASRRAAWILCAGPSVVESGESLDSYPPDARLGQIGSANDLVPWVFTRAPQD